MQQQNTTALQPTLEEVSAHFKHWRQIKRNHREPIPKKLWQEAVELTRQYLYKTGTSSVLVSSAGSAGRIGMIGMLVKR